VAYQSEAGANGKKGWIAVEVCINCSSLATMARTREQQQASSNHRKKGCFSLDKPEDETSVGVLVCLARDITESAHGLETHQNALDTSRLMQEYQ
jgi:hypothetical protein